MDHTQFLIDKKNCENHSDSSSDASSLNSRLKLTQQTSQKNNPSGKLTPNQIFDNLASPSSNFNRIELKNAIKTTNRTEVNARISSLLSQRLSQSENSIKQANQFMETNNSKDNFISNFQNTTKTIECSVNSQTSEKFKEQEYLNNINPSKVTGWLFLPQKIIIIS